MSNYGERRFAVGHVRRIFVAPLMFILVGCVNVGPLPEPPGPVDAESRFAIVSYDPTPLVRAIWDDDPAKVEALLKAGADPNGRWGGGDRLPLSEVLMPHNFGAPRRRDAMARLLLAYGADPNVRFCPFETRLSIEASDVHDRIPPCTNATALTPLMAAARMDHRDVLFRLLDNGARPLDLDWFKSSALDYAQGDFTFRLLLAAAFPGADAERRAANELLRRFHLLPADLLDALRYKQLTTYLQP